MGLCVLNSTNCPACGRKLDGDKCQHCQQTVRSILPSRVKNKDFARGITKYDLHGNFIKSFRNAYDAYPEDNQLGSLKRKQLIKVCRKETRQLDDAQWRFSGDVQDVGEISRGTALTKDIFDIKRSSVKQNL